MRRAAALLLTLLAVAQAQQTCRSELERAAILAGHQTTISREGLTNLGLSQPKARLILNELKRLNFAHTNAQNRTILSLRGQAFLRKVTTLPS